MAIQSDLIPATAIGHPSGLKSDVDAVLAAMSPSLGYERVSCPLVSASSTRSRGLDARGDCLAATKDPAASARAWLEIAAVVYLFARLRVEPA